jgi:hypothetical protein
MKQLLTIAILAFCFSSCSQKHCWNCRITYTNSIQFPTVGGLPGTGVKTVPVCDKTKKEVKEYEAEQSSTDAATNSSVTYDCVRDYYK